MIANGPPFIVHRVESPATIRIFCGDFLATTRTQPRKNIKKQTGKPTYWNISCSFAKNMLQPPINRLMKKYILLVLLTTGIFCLTSCQSKSSRIDDLKEFVEDIQKDSKDYTQEQWEKANEKFGQLLEKINSYDDLSEEELKEVAKLQGQYAATVFKNSGKAIMEQMEKAGIALDGFLEGIDKGLDNEQEAQEEK